VEPVLHIVYGPSGINSLPVKYRQRKCPRPPQFALRCSENCSQRETILGVEARELRVACLYTASDPPPQTRADDLELSAVRPQVDPGLCLILIQAVVGLDLHYQIGPILDGCQLDFVKLAPGSPHISDDNPVTKYCFCTMEYFCKFIHRTYCKAVEISSLLTNISEVRRRRYKPHTNIYILPDSRSRSRDAAVRTPPPPRYLASRHHPTSAKADDHFTSTL
jgi:hypothetical protein